jgi:hypothetical protein
MRSLSPGGVRLPKFIAPRTSAGGSPGFFCGKGGVIVIAALLVARFASGHTLGLSTADFDVADDGRVGARFVFASAEPLRGVRLDRNSDGVVTEDEVRAARGDLAAFVGQGIGVEADGEACPVTFDDAVLGEIDGLVITASFACSPDASNVEATLYYLAALGIGHKEIARIAAGETSTEAVLTGDRRQIALVLPGRAGHGAARARTRAAVFGLAVAALAGFAVALNAWRAKKGAAIARSK